VTIVVSCAGDNELAKDVHSHLMARIYPTDPSCISLHEDEIEIADDKLEMSKKTLMRILKSYIDSHPQLANHDLTEFGDIFTIGIRHDLNEVALSCEMCGYIASSEGDLVIHRRTHGFVFVL
jgi:hypothetical protein